MKALIYIESSVISYYAAKPSRDLIVAAHQQITAEWWEIVRPKVKCFISPFVIQEVSYGDKKAAKKRINPIKSFTILDLNREIQVLSQKYYEAIDIPEKAKLDASHLAVAVWHEMDYILSWNCKHIVNGRVKKILEEINKNLDIKTPVLCTPEELMEV